MDINSVGPRSQVYVPSPNPNGHHLPKVNQEQMRAVLALGVKGGSAIPALPISSEEQCFHHRLPLRGSNF
jgi:hypothetical protein